MFCAWSWTTRKHDRIVSKPPHYERQNTGMHDVLCFHLANVNDLESPFLFLNVWHPTCNVGWIVSVYCGVSALCTCLVCNSQLMETMQLCLRYEYFFPRNVNVNRNVCRWFDCNLLGTTKLTEWACLISSRSYTSRANRGDAE